MYQLGIYRHNNILLNDAAATVSDISKSVSTKSVDYYFNLFESLFQL